MAFRAAFLLICTFALTFSIWAMPQPDASNESNESDVSDRETLILSTLNDFAALDNNVNKEAKNIFSKVLKDSRLVDTNNEFYKEEMKKMAKFVEKSQKLEDSYTADRMNDLFELTEEFGKLLEQYDTTEKNNPTEEQIMLEKILIDNGMEELIADFEKRFLDFSKKFNIKFEQYVETLNEQQKEEESKMLDWYKDFKGETVFEKKVDVFVKLFEFLNED